MKTPEEMAEEYAFVDIDVEASYVCEERKHAFLAGYQAAKDQLADASKVIPDMESFIEALYADMPVAKEAFLRSYRETKIRLNTLKPQWISVKDHYPAPSNDDCDAKLVAIKAANGYVFDVADTAHGCRWANDYGESVEHEDHEVTHWMPLPEPPEDK